MTSRENQHFQKEWQTGARMYARVRLWVRLGAQLRALRFFRSRKSNKLKLASAKKFLVFFLFFVNFSRLTAVKGGVTLLGGPRGSLIICYPSFPLRRSRTSFLFAIPIREVRLGKSSCMNCVALARQLRDK